MAAPVMHQLSEQELPYHPSHPYEVSALPHLPEDILFCVDVDRAIDAEMKGASTSRLETVKQALLLFISAKVAIDARHRFAVVTLGDTAKWHHREFTRNSEALKQSINALSSQGLFFDCDLLALFKLAAMEAKARPDRVVRVILIYVRSTVIPTLGVQWPAALRTFTCDAIYLHDKPNKDNCPQEVYDVLVQVLETVSNHEMYILESSAGLAKAVFRSMCVLLSHPQQRAPQDELGEMPRDLAKLFPPPSFESAPAPPAEEKKRKEDKKSKEEKKAAKEEKKKKPPPPPPDEKDMVTVITVTRPGLK